MKKNVFFLQHNTEFFIKLIKRWHNPKKKDFVLSILFIIFLIFLVSELVFLTGGTKYVYMHLMYIPLILAAFHFGTRGAIIFGILAGYFVSFVPLDSSTMEMQSTANWVYRLIFFVIVSSFNGFITGKVSDTFKSIEKLTFYNHITNFPNRKDFDTFFKNEEILKNKHLALLELENFNQILNDYGNFILEDFIKKLILNIDNTFNNNVKLFHFQDNTFAILIDNYEVKSFEKNIKSLNQKIIIDNIFIYPEFSIGVAKFTNNQSTLLHHSEMARAYARKNLFLYYKFTDNLTKLQNKKLAILNEIPDAIKDNQFIPYFHPKVNMQTGLIDSAEVLIRWIHPKDGLISPYFFMPYMETTNLINTFTNNLIINTLKIQEEWDEDDFLIKLAINTPILCLKNKLIIDTIKNYKKSLHNIEFEILERNFIDNFKEASSIMEEFIEYGIHFALDDFGTNFASVSYLRNLPFDKLKIDQMFTMNMNKNPNDYSIVKHSIQLGKSLGIKVIAEGVETTDIYDQLKKLNCDYAQGYFTTEPLNAVDFKKFCLEYNQKISNK